MSEEDENPYNLSEAPLPLVRRKEWGALPPKGRRRLNVPILNIIISRTQTDNCTTREECIALMQDMQTKHMAEGHSDIRYNFVVGGDGAIYEGRGWEFSPWNHPQYPQLSDYALELSHVGKFGSHVRWEELTSRFHLVEFGENYGYLSLHPEIKYHFQLK